ncbi:hypothetical protein D1115_22195 [Vibrio alfacsensis]|uniref:Epoxide hydrolase N-terminal domain-containing protein n=1 Tax=Vibrio alfacsensis TaxID=1074311 RepID=A0ABM6Z0B2_9VIBR|nr:epoxide hydrolase N-terminal domain-containing protein [Vibrio alfacsensis]AXY03558.1 hypothetical protein D1115_22195 [Vibrio alfacsensis]
MKNEAIVPFKINIPEEDIADLKRRLEQTRFTDEIDNAGWDYGTNLGYLKQLVQYWLTEFDWRTEENALNEFEQYKTNIDGLDLHFVHQNQTTKRKNPSTDPWLARFIYGVFKNYWSSH